MLGSVIIRSVSTSFCPFVTEKYYTSHANTFLKISERGKYTVTKRLDLPCQKRREIIKYVTRRRTCKRKTEARESDEGYLSDKEGTNIQMLPPKNNYSEKRNGSDGCKNSSFS